MKIKLVITFLFISVLGFAQNKGTITGTLTDKDLNNETLPFANVVLKGTTIGVTTDEMGKYSISIEAGTYTIQFSFLGYENIEEKVEVKAGETITLNKALGSGNYQLQDVVIQNTVSREKESVLLLDQKKAVEIKQSIGAQEMSRKGVSDVATAVTKTTGITKQEGTGNIFVRGLGDRYNSTTMNGLPIPSQDPEKKNLNLEIFSTDIVESVSIDKVYSTRLFGDFAGGNVDIISKDYKGKGFLKFDIGSKINTNSVTEDNFKLQKGYNSFGFSTTTIPNNPLTSYGFNTLQLESKNPFAGTIGLSGGKNFNIGSEGKLNLFATASYSNEYNSITDGSVKSINGSGVANKDFNDFTSMSYSTNFTGMVNIGYKMNSNNKINFNSIFINTAALSKEEYTGYFVDGGDDGNGFIRRNKYDKNTLWINQLLGDHKLSSRSKFNWGVSYNTITGDQPDRTQNTLNLQPAGGYILLGQSAANNHRYFQKLDETEVATNLSVDYKFNKNADGDFKGKFTVGYSAKIKKRNFEATQFNFKPSNANSGDIVDINNLDLFFNQQNYTNDFFEISTFRGNSNAAGATNPQFYKGDLFVNGGYLNTEYKFNKVTAVIGLRGEYLLQKVQWNTSLDPDGGSDELDKIAFLPSLILKYELNEKQNLRFGFSKTYTLPQFKERALFIYEEVNESKIGNPNLYESDDYNVDIKWELFPKSEELVSITAFGKYILNPINEVTIVSSTNDVSYVNTGDYGYVAGAEVEYRKLLFNFSEGNAKKLSAGINASYLYSNQELNSAKVIKETDYNVAFTNKESKLTGASDLLLNADISFLSEWNNKESNLTSTIAFSQFSDRVYSIGTNNRGNQVDKAFGTLDFITKVKLNKNLGFGLVAKNLLNPTINRVQENNSGDVNVLSYKRGVALSLGVNYQF
ncbi:TonB-dependent receptor [Flavobacterium sp.]|uniref:TonB-dependent receptor n=1 Tax=Flavobacterium sp. TaxID=239 RepID=UPI00248A1882|nr:TonB-dependent receptor [Flavobacterium sp.]MDI1316296.1 TonB-dependent receptor [Flavobacterium sp.]